MGNKQVKPLQAYLRWPHMQADQVRGLSLREIGGGFTKHHRAPSIRSACYAVAKPLTMVQKMQNKMKLRGHRSAVYCGKVISSYSTRSCYIIFLCKQSGKRIRYLGLFPSIFVILAFLFYKLITLFKKEMDSVFLNLYCFLICDIYVVHHDIFFHMNLCFIPSWYQI